MCYFGDDASQVKLKIVPTLYQQHYHNISLKTNTKLHSNCENEPKMTEMSVLSHDAMLLLHDTTGVMVRISTHERAA